MQRSLAVSMNISLRSSGKYNFWFRTELERRSCTQMSRSARTFKAWLHLIQNLFSVNFESRIQLLNEDFYKIVFVPHFLTVQSQSET